MTSRSIFPRSIRTQLIMIVALLALPAAGLIIHDGFDRRSIAIQNAYEDTRRLCYSIANEQKLLIDGAQQVVSVLSQLPELKSHDWRAMSALLRDLRQKNPQYANIAITDPSGIVWAAGTPFANTISLADRKFFRDAVRTRRFSSGEYAIGKMSKKPLINFGYPVLDESGRLVAVIAIAIDLDFAPQILLNAGLPPESGISLLDNRGTIIFRSLNDSHSARLIGRLDYRRDYFLRMVEGGEEGTFRTKGNDGILRLVAYRKMTLPTETKPYLYIRASIPERAATTRANNAMVRSLATFSPFFLLALGGAWFVSRFVIFDRVVALQKAARHLASGNMETRVTPAINGGELGELANAFDEMARSLAYRENEWRKFSVAIVQSPVSVILADRMGTIEFVNPKFTQLTGYSSEEAVGQNPRILKSGETPPETYRKLWSTIEAGNVWEGDLRNRKKSGDLFWEHATISPIRDSNNDITHYIAIKEDISARKQLEEQLLHSQKMEAVGQLAGGVAHDFNNLLQVIIGYIHIVQHGLDEIDPLQESIVHVIQASERAVHLTQSLLAFSRRQVMRLENADLNGIVRHVEMFLKRIIGEDVILKTIFKEKHIPLYADCGQIEQVLINLATNARDAMPNGGSLIIETELLEADEAFIDIHGDAVPGRYARISVSDTGQGICDENRKKVFEPFFTTKEKGRGTGLGLSIVYGIVKQHNGFIDLYSEPGVGTVFKVYLPVGEAIPDAKPGNDITASPRTGTETILVAEDDADIRELIEIILKEHGYKVILAVDGQDAVEKFRENHGQVDCILMDMVMPRKNGRDAYEEIRLIHPGVRALFLSGYTGDFMRERGELDAGIELLNKPVRPLELLRKIRETLDR